jgi:long-chain acyl-CoA synthetase
VQGYGLTETTSRISVNNPFHVGRRSIGRLLPGREVKLAPDGEILVRGENISGGYWQGSRLQSTATEDGWFHTGDLGEFDSTGNLYFKGRKKNLIVTAAGMNIHPEDLEAVVKHEPGVRDCVVVGVPVSSDTEPCAILLLSPGTGAASVIRAANQHLADYQQLRRWKVWPETDFPRTPTQKPRLAELESFARLAESEPSAVSHASILGALVNRIRGGNAAISPDSTLDALNLSSLDRVELLSAIEDRYQVNLSERSFTDATTVADLERQLRAETAAATQYVYPRWPLHPVMRSLRSLGYYALTFPATLLMARPRVVGSEHLRGLRGPVLIVSNHVTYIDIGFILYALPPMLRSHLAVAMQGALLMEMRQPPGELNPFARLLQRLGYYLVISLFNVFPLPQSANFRRSFEFAGRCVDLGYSVLIFPEGRRTPNGELSRFQAGAGILAERLNLPVVPMRIDGLWQAAQAHRHFLRPGEIVVRIGQPVQYKAGENPSSIASDLQRRVEQLVDHR